MDDYISREIAMERIKYKKPKVLYSEYGVGYERGLEDAIGLLNAIPSADVQPVKHGHWIEEVREIGETFRLYQTYIHCSECGKEHYSGTLPKPNFCDNCGADMRGTENE